MVINVEKEMNELAEPIMMLFGVLKKQGRVGKKPFRLSMWVQGSGCGVIVDGITVFEIKLCYTCKKHISVGRDLCISYQEMGRTEPILFCSQNFVDQILVAL